MPVRQSVFSATIADPWTLLPRERSGFGIRARNADAPNGRVRLIGPDREGHNGTFGINAVALSQRAWKRVGETIRILFIATTAELPYLAYY